MFPSKPARAFAIHVVAPDDLVDEVPPPEYRVHERFEVVRSGRVAVQVDASGRLEDATHGQQTHSHEAHERAHTVRMGATGTLYRLHQSRVVILDLVYPLLMHVLFP